MLPVDGHINRARTRRYVSLELTSRLQRGESLAIYVNPVTACSILDPAGLPAETKLGGHPLIMPRMLAPELDHIGDGLDCVGCNIDSREGTAQMKTIINAVAAATTTAAERRNRISRTFHPRIAAV